MLVRKCDVCNHIIGDEDGYMIDIFKTSMSRGAEVRTKTLNISLEICSKCKQAMFNALKREINKYVLIEKEQEAEVLDIPKDCRYSESLDKSME